LSSSLVEVYKSNRAALISIPLTWLSGQREIDELFSLNFSFQEVLAVRKNHTVDYIDYKNRNIIYLSLYSIRKKKNEKHSGHSTSLCGPGYFLPARRYPHYL